MVYLYIMRFKRAHYKQVAAFKRILAALYVIDALSAHKKENFGCGVRVYFKLLRARILLNRMRGAYIAVGKRCKTAHIKPLLLYNNTA